MNKEIIASFEFDDDKLLQSLTETKEQILAIKEAQKQIAGTTGMASEAYIQNAARLKELNAEYNEGLKIINARQRAFAIDIDNYNREGKSIRELRKETQDLIKIRNEMRINGEQNSASFQKLNTIIDENTEKIKQNVSAYEKQKMNIGNYSQGIVDAWEKIKTGDVKGAVSQIDELGEAWRSNSMSIGGVWKQIAAIPVIGWLTGIAAVLLMGVNEMIKYNTWLNEINKTTAAITKLQGDALDNASLKAKVLEDAFGFESQETLEAARALVQQFGIDYAEALQLIEDGAIRGGSANKEYLESIKEYPTFFAQAGYSAKEFIALINAGADAGIFKDKLVDAVKEFELSIKEQTPATRAALVNAFGAPFADELLKKVNEGKITTKQALVELSNESQKYNLTLKQQQQLTADIFRGAGEDAGGFSKIMQAVVKSQIDWNKPLTESQQILAKKIGLMNELEIAQHNALKSDGLLAFKNVLQEVLTRGKILWYNFITEIWNAIKGVRLGFMNIRDLSLIIPGAITAVFRALKRDFSDLGGAVKIILQLLNDLRNFNFSGVGANFEKLQNHLANSFKNTRAVVNEVKSLPANINARNVEIINSGERNRAEEERKRMDAEANKPTNNFDGTAGAKANKSSGKTKREESAEKEAKNLEQIAEKNRDNAVKYFESELAKYLEVNKSKIEGAKFLTNALIDIEQEREQAILDKKIETFKLIRDKELENTKLTADQKATIENEYQKKVADAQQEFQEKTAENARKINEQMALWNDEYAVAEQEKKLKRLEEAGASEFEIKQAQLDYEWETNQERKAIEDELNLLASEEQDAAVLERKAFLNDQLTALEADHQDKKVEVAAAAEDAKLSLYADVAGSIAQIAGQQSAVGKAAAIAQSTINTYQGATKAFAEGGFWGIAQGAMIIAAGLANVAKIAGVKTDAGGGFAALAQSAKSAKSTVGTKRKAEKGILLEGSSHALGGLQIYDQYGNHLVEAEGGEMLAVINKKSTLAMLSDMNVAGGGIPLTSYVKRAERGGMINTAIGNSQFDISRAIAESVYKATLEGTYAGSQRGLKDMATDRTILNEATI